jgi:hypothetical protein
MGILRLLELLWKSTPTAREMLILHVDFLFLYWFNPSHVGHEEDNFGYITLTEHVSMSVCLEM